MRKTRIIIQLLLFIFFMYLFFSTVYPMDKNLPNPFTRISPLYTLALSIMGKFKWDYLASFLLLLLAIFLGRFFCGWVCPMGTSIDISEKLLGSSENRKETRNFSYLKYFLLVIIFTSALGGFSTIHWFEPITLVYRFFTFSIFPAVNIGWKFIGRFIPALSKINLSYVSVSYRTGTLFLLIFLAIFLLGRYCRRFWCRNLCPLGALLSVASRFSIIVKKVSDKCIECGKCTRDCKMGAIPLDPHAFKVMECIYCFNCVKVCPVNAISFGLDKPLELEKLKQDIKNFLTGKKPQNPEMSSGFSRRNFLEGAAFGAVVAVMAKTDFGKVHKYERLIRPPAALPEGDFNVACIRCGECMKVCMTNGLQPTFTEGGMEGIMTPRLIPAHGHCEYHCNMCQKVCPTGAIQPFEIEDKRHIKLGIARINRSSCIAWYQDEYCLVCDEHCSYKAIYWKQIDGRLRPLVDQDVCVGCGYCENRCPVKPEAAIQVFAQGEKRIYKPAGQKWSVLNPITLDSPSRMHQSKPLKEGSDIYE